MDEYAITLAWAPGREEEAIRRLRAREQTNPPGRLRHAISIAFRNYLEGERGASLAALEEGVKLGFHDPEARFAMGVLQAKLNEPQAALETISQALEEGYVCHYTLLHHPWLELLRTHPDFPELASRAAERRSRAQAVFLENGGDRLLGVQMDREPPIDWNAARK